MTLIDFQKAAFDICLQREAQCFIASYVKVKYYPYDDWQAFAEGIYIGFFSSKEPPKFGLSGLTFQRHGQKNQTL